MPTEPEGSGLHAGPRIKSSSNSWPMKNSWPLHKRSYLIVDDKALASRIVSNESSAHFFTYRPGYYPFLSAPSIGEQLNRLCREPSQGLLSVQFAQSSFLCFSSRRKAYSTAFSQTILSARTRSCLGSFFPSFLNLSHPLH